MAWSIAEWRVETGTEPAVDPESSTPSGETPTQPAKKKLPIQLLQQSEDKKPLLIYFFFPPDKDKKDVRGKKCALFEDRAFNDEEVARISKYFACHRLDVSGLDEKSLAANGVTTVPTVLITDCELNVLATIADHKMSAAKLLSTIIAAMQKKLPDVWKQFCDDRKKAEEVFDEGLQLMKEKKYEEALAKFEAVVKMPAAALSLVKRAASQVETVKARLKMEKQD